MFAVFEDGGRQFRVKSGDVLAVDYRNDVQDGQAITFDKILLANGGGPSIVGQPVISGATVTAQLKGLKLEIQTFHRRNASKRHTGHRQKYTRVKITGITVPNLTVVERPVAPATT